eukprot:1161222-Pelagomonas_calceolata.AAC.18
MSLPGFRAVSQPVTSQLNRPSAARPLSWRGGGSQSRSSKRQQRERKRDSSTRTLRLLRLQRLGTGTQLPIGKPR